MTLWKHQNQLVGESVCRSMNITQSIYPSNLGTVDARRSRCSFTTGPRLVDLQVALTEGFIMATISGDESLQRHQPHKLEERDVHWDDESVWRSYSFRTVNGTIVWPCTAFWKVIKSLEEMSLGKAYICNSNITHKHKYNAFLFVACCKYRLNTTFMGKQTTVFATTLQSEWDTTTVPEGDVVERGYPLIL